MGRFQIDNSVVGKALSIGAGDDTIDSRSAWLFENQSGTLGTNLSGSQIYTGAGGNIKAILSGVTGTQGTVLVLDGEDPYGANPSYNGFSNGSGYVTATGLATRCSSSVPKSPAEQPSGLTVDIVVTLPTASITSNGSGKLDIDCETVPTVNASDPWDTVGNQRFLIIDEDSNAIGYRTATQSWKVRV